MANNCLQVNQLPELVWLEQCGELQLPVFVVPWHWPVAVKQEKSNRVRSKRGCSSDCGRQRQCCSPKGLSGLINQPRTGRCLRNCRPTQMGGQDQARAAAHIGADCWRQQHNTLFRHDSAEQCRCQAHQAIPQAQPCCCNSKLFVRRQVTRLLSGLLGCCRHQVQHLWHHPVGKLQAAQQVCEAAFQNIRSSGNAGCGQQSRDSMGVIR